MKTRTLIPVLLVSLLATALVPSAASAASWGRGTFTGQVKGQFGPRPKSKIVLSAKGRKVRIKSVRLEFKCDPDNRLGLPARFSRTIHTESVRVKEGPAGGGAIFRFNVSETYGDKPFRIRGDSFLGLRDTKIDGTISAMINTGGLPTCFDDGIFTARK